MFDPNKDLSLEALVRAQINERLQNKRFAIVCMSKGEHTNSIMLECAFIIDKEARFVWPRAQEDFPDAEVACPARLTLKRADTLAGTLNNLNDWLDLVIREADALNGCN